MEFGEQLKKIRTAQQLTQAQFAVRINVTRQAVSNWENNRNLPDLEMVILIATIFNLSLDELILGGTHVNNMTEKLIKDGRETRRAKFNLITVLIGAFLLILGVVCFLIKGNSVEYVDSTGLLHENFYLLPIGFAFLFAGLMVFAVIGLNTLVGIFRTKK